MIGELEACASLISGRFGIDVLEHQDIIAGRGWTGGLYSWRSGKSEKCYRIAIKESMVSEFKNVTVVKEANVYFEGKVTSRTLEFADGSKKTLGVMLPGEYTFNTGAPEIMEILAGNLDVLLPNEMDWRTINGGESFEVPGQSKFSLRVKNLADYCCSFVEE